MCHSKTAKVNDNDGGDQSRDDSSGFHIIEVHARSAGIGVLVFLCVLAALVLLGWIIWKCCCRRIVQGHYGGQQNALSGAPPGTFPGAAWGMDNRPQPPPPKPPYPTVPNGLSISPADFIRMAELARGAATRATTAAIAEAPLAAAIPI